MFGLLKRYPLFRIWAFGEMPIVLYMGLLRGICCSVYGPLERHLLFCVWAFGEAAAVLCLGLWRGICCSVFGPLERYVYTASCLRTSGCCVLFYVFDLRCGMFCVVFKVVIWSGFSELNALFSAFSVPRCTTRLVSLQI